MVINLHDIISPEAGLSHLFWELIFIFVWGHIVKRLKDFFSNQPKGWALKKLLTVAGILCGYGIIAFCAATILSQCVYVFGSIVRPKTNFKPEFITGDLSDADPKHHMLAIELRISNDGAPSTTKGWGLTITGVDNKTTSAFFLLNPPYPITIVNSDGTTKLLESKDSLTEKTRSFGFGNGDTREGHVIFLIPEINRRFLEAHGTLYKVYLKDIYDKTYTVDFRWPSPVRE